MEELAPMSMNEKTFPGKVYAYLSKSRMSGEMIVNLVFSAEDVPHNCFVAEYTLNNYGVAKKTVTLEIDVDAK